MESSTDESTKIKELVTCPFCGAQATQCGEGLAYHVACRCGYAAEVTPPYDMRPRGVHYIARI